MVVQIRPPRDGLTHHQLKDFNRPLLLHFSCKAAIRYATKDHFATTKYFVILPTGRARQSATTTMSMPTYRREPYNPVCFPPPAVPFNGGYGAYPTSQVPFWIKDNADMCYPRPYPAFQYAVGQEPHRLPWSYSTQPASEMQWSPQPYANPLSYLYMDSQYYCGQSAMSYNTHADYCVGIDSNSASQTQSVSHAPFMAQSPTALSLSPSTNRQEKFIRTVARKVYITRPTKYAWNFSNAQIHAMVDCCIARLSVKEH